MFRMKLFKPSNIICISVNVISTSTLLMYSLIISGVKSASTMDLVLSVCKPDWESAVATTWSFYGCDEELESAWNLSRIILGENGYIPVPRNPEVTFVIVIPLLHASANNVENWNFVTTCPGWWNKYWRHTSFQYFFSGPKQLVS